MRLLLVACLLLGGCRTATEQIAYSSAEIRTLAESSKQRFIRLDEPKGEAEQERIIGLTEAVAKAIPGVQEKPSELLGLLEILAIAGVCVAVAIVVWQLGLGHLTRSLFSWVPARKKAAAKLLDEAVDPNHETNMREAVAALRAMDPELDLAFRKHHAHSR